jgi:hypothetical protein
MIETVHEVASLLMGAVFALVSGLLLFGWPWHRRGSGA